MIHRYNAFGLCIQSDIKLDELSVEPDSTRLVDVFIRDVDLGYDLKALGEERPSVDFLNSDGVLMVWPGAAAIQFKKDNEILVQMYPSVPSNYMAFPLLGPAMGWLLHQRGALVLHSSAVRIDDISIAFMGDKRAGKSTTATAFLNQGAKLITDDLLVIDKDSFSNPIIHPSFAQVKLNDKSSLSINVADSKMMPLIMPGFDKRQYRLETMMKQATSPDYFFVIERTEEGPGVRWLESGEGFPQLLRYSYFVRFSTAPSNFQHHARHFQNCVNLEKHTSIGVLSVPIGEKRLDSTVRFMREFLSSKT